MKLIEYADREMLFLTLANQIAGELGQMLRSHDQVSLVVPGGTTPAPLFELLSDVDLDWARVVVLLSDERWVPEDDPRSNAQLVRRHLLKGPAAAAQFLPLYVAGLEPEAAIADLCHQVAPLLPLGVVLVGMGADMHTASLFPGAEGTEAALAPQAPPLAVIRGESLEVARVTLSAPALAGAMHVHVLITGEEKRKAAARAAKLAPALAPVTSLLDCAEIHWSE